MAIRVTVSTAAVDLGAATTDGAEMLVDNTGSVPVYLDVSSTVTTSTGKTLASGSAMTVPLKRDQHLYAIASSSTTIEVWRGRGIA